MGARDVFFQPYFRLESPKSDGLVSWDTVAI